MKKTFSNFWTAMALLAGIHQAVAVLPPPGWSVTLAWNASTSPDVAGYNIYCGTVNGVFTNKISLGKTTSATIANLTPGTTYYFAATTVDTNGNESSLSNEADYIVPGILTLSPGMQAGSPALLNFPVEPAHWYAIQATTNFQSWTTIGQTGVATSNAWYQFTDPSAYSYSSRFYRLVLH